VWGRLGSLVAVIGRCVTGWYVRGRFTTLAVLPGLAYKVGGLGPALGGLAGGAWASGTAVGPLLTIEARAGVFHDSGCWDTLLLVGFDRLVRLGMYSAGGWLLSHGLAERASNKVAREVRVWVQGLPTRSLWGVVSLLRLLAVSLGLCAGLGLSLSILGAAGW
jgi:hypothetical protein